MPQIIAYRGRAGSQTDVSRGDPLPVEVVRRSGTFPIPFTYPLAGSVQVLVKAAQGSLCSVIATNINAAIRYLQVFNQNTVPATGNVPVLSLPIPAGTATVPGTFVIGDEVLGKDGLQLAAGVALGISTTAATFTAATASDHTLNGLFS